MPDSQISVAMCTFNASRFLSAQLESIAGQTRLPDELIICDDGSRDKTLEIIEGFARSAKFPVRLETNPSNLGTTRNFEKAVGLSTGDIIALADFDDVWNPNKLAVLDEAFQANPNAGYVFSNAEIIDENGTLINRSMWSSGIFRGWRTEEFTGTNQVSTLLGRSLVTGAAMAFRSSLRKMIIPFSTHFVHDYWISLVLSCMGFYGVVNLEPLMSYRQHASQKTGVRARSIAEKIRLARSPARLNYEQQKSGYQDLRDRMVQLAHAGYEYPESHLALVDQVLAHWRSRSAAHCARGIARSRIVFAEVFSGRYKRFSNAWQSIIQDLCF